MSEHAQHRPRATGRATRGGRSWSHLTPTTRPHTDTATRKVRPGNGAAEFPIEPLDPTTNRAAVCTLLGATLALPNLTGDNPLAWPLVATIWLGGAGA